MKTRLLVFIIVLLLLTDLALLYPKLTGKVTGKIEYRYVNVSRVIDGDTLEAETEYGTEKFRLLGINTPEKKQAYYEEAKQFLQQFENKTLKLEDFGKDKYQRTLSYVYFNNQLINREILARGLANLYYYEHDSHFNELKKAEEQARDKGLGIWRKSENYGCVELIELKYQEQERCQNQEQLILKNNCETINAVLKDDATHIYNLKLNTGMFEKNFSCIWNNEGDSLYLSDDSGLLVFYRY